MQLRNLQLNNLNDAIEEARRIHQRGWQTEGKWTLAQSYEHMAVAMELTITGLPIKFAWPIRLVGRYFIRPWIFRNRKIKSGITAPPVLQPETGVSENTALERFIHAAEKLRNHDGPLPAHPVFGPMTTEQWQDFHTIHCQHHLSHFTPTESG